MSEKVHRKIRQQVGYKPNSKSDETRVYDIIPRTRILTRRILVDGKRVLTEVGRYHTGQRVNTRVRKLVRAMKRKHKDLARAGIR